MQAGTLRRLRSLHLYAGVFFAPAIIFFAFSGILQTFGLHEARFPGAAEPPAWIKTISSLHKDQVLSQAGGHDHHDHHDADEADHDHPAGATRAATAADYPPPSVGVRKLFVGVMGVALIVSALLGLAIAIGTRSTQRRSVVLAALGVLLPLGLIFA